MHLTLNLNSETAAKLSEQAALRGKQPEELVLEAIDEKLSDDSSASRLSGQRWQTRFDAFLASVLRTAASAVDDSRESIYEGRGE